MTTGNLKIDRCVEVLCGRGCRAVQECIESLHAGRELPELAELDVIELVTLRQELEAIMAVYDSRCDL